MSHPTHRRSRRAALSAAGLALALLAAAPGSAQTVELPGRRADAYVLAGDVHVEAAAAGNIQVRARFTGPHRRRVELSARPGKVSIHYPTDRVVQPGLAAVVRVTVREDGSFDPAGDRTLTLAGSGAGTQARAEMRISLPAGKSVTVHLVSGSVHAGPATRTAAGGRVETLVVENANGTLRITQPARAAAAGRD